MAEVEIGEGGVRGDVDQAQEHVIEQDPGHSAHLGGVSSLKRALHQVFSLIISSALY